MNRILLVLTPLLISFSALCKEAKYTNRQIRSICDSIVIEGNILYRYEKAAWVSTDMGLEQETVKNELFNYLVYEDGDVIKSCLLNDKLECIYEVRFTGNECEPADAILGTRALNEEEEKLFIIRNTIINNIVEGDYDVEVAEGFDLNFVLLPSHNGYRLYILTGTSQLDIIPFGNDYIFFTDLKGNITDWRKMHSILLPIHTTYEGGKVKETIHTHLPAEPFITATDICTFKLYGPFNEQKTFKVISVLNKVMTYDIASDSITVKNI